MKELLNELYQNYILTRFEAKEALRKIAFNEVSSAQTASFLTVFLMRGITLAELEGFRETMLEACLPMDLHEFDPIDLCGTGGDGKNTFNISTTSAFVVAGAGVKVAKHGNNAVSSSTGSSNLLEALGLKFTNDIDKLRSNIDKSNICFLHAPLFHPAMKNVAPIRKEMAVKTFFNILGPMVNPCFPNKQIIGVYSLELLRLYGYLYQKLDKKFLILHALDGYDENSLTCNVKIFTKSGEKIITPTDLGRKKLSMIDLKGGSNAEESAKIFLSILQNIGTEAQNEVVIANAGLAISCANEIDFITGQNMAKESLESGKAYQVFKKIIES